MKKLFTFLIVLLALNASAVSQLTNWVQLWNFNGGSLTNLNGGAITGNIAGLSFTGAFSGNASAISNSPITLGQSSVTLSNGAAIVGFLGIDSNGKATTNNSGASMTSIPAANLTGTASVNTSGRANISTNLSFSGIRYTNCTQTFTTTSIVTTAWADITNLNITYSCGDASSKVMVRAYVMAACDSSHSGLLRLVRDTTALGVGDAGGASQTRANAVWTDASAANNDTLKNFSFEFLDSPGDTSSHTYKVQAAVATTGGTIYVNRTVLNANQPYDALVGSSLSIQEFRP